MINQAHSRIPHALTAIGFAFLATASLHAQTTDSISLELRNAENTLIPLDPVQSVTIDPDSGNLVVTPADPLACTASSAADCTDVRVENVTLTAEPSNVSQGQEITLRWDSRGAWDCQGVLSDSDTGALITSTDWDDVIPRDPRGSDGILTSTLDPDTFVAEIECRNGPKSQSATAQFTVTDPNPDVPQFCIDEGRMPPTGMTQDKAIVYNDSRTTTEWGGTWGQPYPDGNQRNIAVEPDRYVAIAFDTGSVPVGTTVRTSISDPQFSTTVAPGDKMITVSECPGDFGPQPDSGCRVVMSGGQFTHTIGGDNGFCNLEQGTVYYLNILYTDQNLTTHPDSSPTNWFCTGGVNGDTATCGNIISP